MARAKDAGRAAKTSPEARSERRASVEWQYTLFYAQFFFYLLLIALFGIISEV